MTAELRLVAFELSDGGDLLPELGAELGRVFQLEARVARAPLELSECFDPLRAQYDARRVLSVLADRAAAGFVLGVTEADLFMPVFTFVLGEALLGGKAAVISTFRLRDERYGLPPSPGRLRDRLLKEAVHELGHCHGLTHCMSSRCVMFAAAGVEEVDLKGRDLCARCRQKLSA